MFLMPVHTSTVLFDDIVLAAYVHYFLVELNVTSAIKQLPINGNKGSVVVAVVFLNKRVNCFFCFPLSSHLNTCGTADSVVILSWLICKESFFAKISLR